jgi:hypothetical protein
LFSVALAEFVANVSPSACCTAPAVLPLQYYKKPEYKAEVRPAPLAHAVGKHLA